MIFLSFPWVFLGQEGRQVGRLARSLAEVGIMILASVLALFYRAAIGSQSELKIMTVGRTPPPKQVGCFLSV